MTNADVWSLGGDLPADLKEFLCDIIYKVNALEAEVEALKLRAPPVSEKEGGE